MASCILSSPMVLLITILSYSYVPSSSSINCQLTACPDGRSVQYPFWQIGNDSAYCGYPGFGIECSDIGRSVVKIANNSYYVESSDYYGNLLTVVDVDIWGSECPRPVRSFVANESSDFEISSRSYMYIFFNCSLYPPDVLHITCLEHDIKRSYAVHDTSDHPLEDWQKYCEEYVVLPALTSTQSALYLTDSIYKSTLKQGFRLTWNTPFNCDDCEESGGKCLVNRTTNDVSCLCGESSYQICYHKDFAGTWPNGQVSETDSPVNAQILCTHTLPCTLGLGMGMKVIIGGSTGLGGLLLLTTIIFYRKRVSSLQKSIFELRKSIKAANEVDLFLESYGDLSLQRYTYSSIKKMTNLFGEILGQGGYGSVFKGKLTDGRLVAVKVLKEAKGSGEEFINEVATIGTTNHVNVVRLLGFCSDRRHRALVYEFMTNGSLERFINTGNISGATNPLLGREQLYQIALGIAKGLEYLHSGCNNRILHFDIKPHNILLDQKLCPKISDFGLAKLYKTRESFVSMLGARGTIGYIAPEICFRNIGSVSYKSDVYSYGMLVLEMIGKRKNSDMTVNNTGELYFPHWIYTHLEQDKHVVESKEFFKEDVIKKMIIVGLWCIQTHPASRPSMSKVVEMLEGNIEDLDIPPNPVTDTQPVPYIISLSTSSTS